MYVFANLSNQIDILNSQYVNIRSLHVFYFISLNCLLVTVTGLISDLQIFCTSSKDTKKDKHSDFDERNALRNIRELTLRNLYTNMLKT